MIGRVTCRTPLLLVCNSKHTTSLNFQQIGVIQAINKNSGIFTKDDEGLLTILSSLANTIIKNSMYFDKEKLFHNSLRAILNVSIRIFGVS